MDDVQTVLSHFRADYASMAGFAVEGGTVNWTSQGGESVEVGVIVPLDAEVQVVLEASTGVMEGTQEDTLLPRIDKALHGWNHPKVLKHGARVVSGLNGHEYVDVWPDPASRDRFVFSA